MGKSALQPSNGWGSFRLLLVIIGYFWTPLLLSNVNWFSGGCRVLLDSSAVVH